MSRPLRIEYEGAFYHVICRGERRDDIFRCSTDKEKFLKKLGETVEKYGLFIHAYVLMDNHYHLLVETPRANLSPAMHQLNASYGNWFRCKYQVIGSVFQGRFKAILVEKDDYLKVLSAYIHLNPVRAGIAAKPESYPFSSYSFFTGGKEAPKFLRTADLSAMFGGGRAYQRYVESFPAAGEEIGADEIYGKNSLLGSECFLRKELKKERGRGKPIDKKEQPEARAVARVGENDVLEVLLAEMRIPEEDVWKRKRGNVYRKLLVYALRRYTDHSLKEIGKVMGMEYSAVSGLARRFEKEMASDPRLRSTAEQLEKGIAQRRLLNG